MCFIDIKKTYEIGKKKFFLQKYNNLVKKKKKKKKKKLFCCLFIFKVYINYFKLIKKVFQN